MLPEHAPRGNWATLLLPLRDDDSIDESVLAEEIDLFSSFGVDGVYSNGTAGEFYNQTEDEFHRIQEILSDRCGLHNLPFQVGVSHPFPAVTLDRIRRCRALGASAFQVILPDWFPPTFEEIVSYLERVAAAAAPIPIVLYNPPHAKVRLAPAQLLCLADRVPGLVGVKVPGGDAVWYEQMQPVFGRLSVFVPGHTLASGVLQGAHGAYSNVACLHPGAAQQWWNLIHRGAEEALEWEGRIQQFMREAVHPFIGSGGYSNQSVDKLMAAVGGWSRISPRLRWPYRWLGDDAVRATRETARRLLPEFVSSDVPL